jgi:hypothetical protein
MPAVIVAVFVAIWRAFVAIPGFFPEIIRVNDVIVIGVVVRAVVVVVPGVLVGFESHDRRPAA